MHSINIAGACWQPGAFHSPIGNCMKLCFLSWYVSKDYRMTCEVNQTHWVPTSRIILLHSFCLHKNTETMTDYRKYFFQTLIKQIQQTAPKHLASTFRLTDLWVSRAQNRTLILRHSYKAAASSQFVPRVHNALLKFHCCVALSRDRLIVASRTTIHGGILFDGAPLMFTYFNKAFCKLVRLTSTWTTWLCLFRLSSMVFEYLASWLEQARSMNLFAESVFFTIISVFNWFVIQLLVGKVK